jgi:lipoprotein-anchoring transpeptidase ErfK/SrfK
MACKGGGGDLCQVGQVSVIRSTGLTAAFLPAALSRIGRAGRRGLAIAVLALAVLVLAAPSGEAQPRVSGATATRAKKDSKVVSGAPGRKDKAATAPATGPLLAVVSIARQRIQVYGGAGLVTQAPVSTGMAGHRTPTGVFSVLQKRRHHHSNIYSNAPMPYMQRLTWSGIALHAGVLPGYPASHGCIRLPYGFAAELWGMTGVGTRVVVAPDDAPAVAIEDPRLPAPRLTPLPLDDERLREEAGRPVSGPTLASAAAQTVVDAGDELGRPGAPRLGPWQRAIAARTLAARNVADTAKAAKQAVEAAKASTAEARIAQAALRRVELGLAAAQRRRDTLARAAAAASRPLVAERAAHALAAAEDGLAEAQRAADEAGLIEAARSQEAFEAASTAADAEEARRAAAAAVKAAERILEPISIFVSRKAGRVYVRQAWEPVHEAPVTFTDAGPPLGTHVYLATGATADTAALRWLSVSLPASAPRPQRPHVRRGEPAPPPRLPAETAAGALARFELPEATWAFIADRLWAGTTLIVSDHGVSGETGVGTDFIVLSR